MLEKVDIQGEYGLAGNDSREVVRLKKKANALIECLEKVQKENQYLKDQLKKLDEIAPAEQMMKEILYFLRTLNQEAKWMDYSYQTVATRNYYRLTIEAFKEIWNGLPFSAPKKDVLKLMSDMGILKSCEGRYTFPITKQKRQYRVYMFRKEAVDALIVGELS